mgnify:CR=1 FL=1
MTKIKKIKKYNFLFAALCLFIVSISTHADGIRFEETMAGYGSVDGIYRPMRVNLNVNIDDLDTWENNINHTANITGEMLIEGLPTNTVNGTLNIFSPSTTQSCPPSVDSCYHLVYSLKINDGSAIPNYFVGFKTVSNDAGFDMIDDLTTLQACFTQNPNLPLEDYLSDDCRSTIQVEWWKDWVLWDFYWSFEVYNKPWYRWSLTVKLQFLKVVFGPVAETYFGWLSW